MLTRRSFLQSTALALTIPTSGNTGVINNLPSTGRVRVLTDLSCGDGRRFRRSLPLQTASTEIDEGAYLESIVRDLHQDRFDYLLGLTHNSDYILLSQMAFEHGWRLIYQGRHHYDSDGLRHTVSADVPVAEILAVALGGQGRPWPRALAAALPTMTQSAGTRRTIDVRTRGRPPSDSRGFLLSWAMAPGSA